jgi:hypothetical protein
MSNTSKSKGSAAERAFAQAVGGQRVPLSGAARGYPGDVKALGLVWEVKQRRNGGGWKQLAEWLKGKDALALHQPYKGWLVVLPLETFLNLLPEEKS